MTLIKNYAQNEKYRKSMSQLAVESFGLDFELLFEKGYWGEKFNCYGILENDEIVSNASFHELTLEKDGRKYSALQVGTVMTRSSHRKKGYAKQLMDEILKDFAQKDVIYLFANESVMTFYPKFGFETKQHLKYEDHDISLYKQGQTWEKIDLEKDLEALDQAIKCRVKNSVDDYIYGDDYIKMFYALYVFKHCIYRKDDVFILCEQEGDTLYVHDLYSAKPVNIHEVVGAFIKDAKQISYGFHPQIDGLICVEDKESGLFVRTTHQALLTPWQYPITSVT